MGKRDPWFAVAGAYPRQQQVRRFSRTPRSCCPTRRTLVFDADEPQSLLGGQGDSVTRSRHPTCHIVTPVLHSSDPHTKPVILQVNLNPSSIDLNVTRPVRIVPSAWPTGGLQKQLLCSKASQGAQSPFVIIITKMSNILIIRVIVHILVTNINIALILPF